MMTSSNGNIFRVTGHLCGEITGPRRIPAQRPLTRSFDVFFDLRLKKRLCKQSYHEAGDLRRYRAHYDVTVMTLLELATYSTNKGWGMNKYNAFIHALNNFQLYFKFVIIQM